jgi:hypothetical protein
VFQVQARVAVVPEQIVVQLLASAREYSMRKAVIVWLPYPPSVAVTGTEPRRVSPGSASVAVAVLRTLVVTTADVVE